jgi:hypothetical protein
LGFVTTLLVVVVFKRGGMVELGVHKPKGSAFESLWFKSQSNAKIFNVFILIPR